MWVSTAGQTLSPSWMREGGGWRTEPQDLDGERSAFIKSRRARKATHAQGMSGQCDTRGLGAGALSAQACPI